MKKLLTFGLVGLLAQGMAAQSAAFKLGWDQPDVIPTNIPSLSYTLKIDNATPIIVSPTCVAKAAGSICTIPLPQMTNGPHTLTLTVFNGFGSATSDPLTGTSPAKPVSVTVTVTVTIP